MKNTDDFLNRAFALSRRAPEPPLPSEPPFGLETAVLAHWKSSSRSAGHSGLLRDLRWAAGIACALALLVVIAQRDQLAELARGADPQTRVADSAIAMGSGYE